uniref:Uncharacterized protein n=1 Tax=uncultured marine virus TaxID=186617 RepID=A0A0F7L1R8_9VIRU|nr:hypothetical protein [uncultured marine virus]
MCDYRRTLEGRPLACPRSRPAGCGSRSGCWRVGSPALPATGLDCCSVPLPLAPALARNQQKAHGSSGGECLKLDPLFPPA